MEAEYASALQDHVTRAMSSGREHSTTSLGTVTAGNAATVLRCTGQTIAGYERLVQSSDIRHVLRSHGDPMIEAARGQVAIRKRDFVLINYIVDRAYIVVAIGRPRSAKPLRLTYTAIVDNHEYQYVEELRPNKVMALKSMRKRE